jgi:CheY-like chemotaxis protein
MPGGGMLIVETERTLLEPAAADLLELEPGEYAVIRVSDTGCGMDARTQAHLFEPFFTTKAPGRGTGLGLATCYGIVSELNGKIDVWSEVGRGSVFTIYLPLAGSAPAELPGAPAQAPPRAEGETILVVEDDAGVRTLARTVLEDAGFVVLDARFGDEALWVADRHDGRIDLLLTDGVMPVMSGRELAERFSGLHPGVKVVYMSGFERETALAGDPSAEHAFLAKPFTPEALVTTVREALRAP